MPGERSEVYSIFGSFKDIRNGAYFDIPFVGFFIKSNSDISGLTYDLERGNEVAEASIRGFLDEKQGLDFEKEYLNGIPPVPIKYRLAPYRLALETSDLWIGRYSLIQPDGTLLEEAVLCQFARVVPPLDDFVALSAASRYLTPIRPRREDTYGSKSVHPAVREG